MHTRFFVEQVHKFRSRLNHAVNANALLIAGRSLVEFTTILDSQPRVISDRAYRDLQRLSEQHLHHAALVGMEFKPKHHMFRHLVAAIPMKGNPRYYHTYNDESLNRTIASLATSVHRATFERRLFLKLDFLRHLDSLLQD